MVEISSDELYKFKPECGNGSCGEIACLPEKVIVIGELKATETKTPN